MVFPTSSTGSTGKIFLLACFVLSFFCDASASSLIALPLQHTGQTEKFSSTYGEDSDHILNPLSFTDNGDGTITDAVSTLMWQKDDSIDMDWESASAYCSTLRMGGYIDWRLPDIHELYSSVNLTYPVVYNAPFSSPNTSAECHWSSNVGRDSEYRWVLYANGDARDVPAGRVDGFRSRCVRYTHSPAFYFSPASRFTVYDDEIAQDNTNGLMWQLSESRVTVTWLEAISYCEELDFADFSDWRLPNIKELFSTCDQAFFSPTIDVSVFKDIESKSMCAYWSSSTQQQQSNNAWLVEYKTGEVTFDSKKRPLNVRCVRAGWPAESQLFKFSSHLN